MLSNGPREESCGVGLHSACELVLDRQGTLLSKNSKSTVTVFVHPKRQRPPDVWYLI